MSFLPFFSEKKFVSDLLCGTWKRKQKEVSTKDVTERRQEIATSHLPAFRLTRTSTTFQHFCEGTAAFFLCTLNLILVCHSVSLWIQNQASLTNIAMAISMFYCNFWKSRCVGFACYQRWATKRGCTVAEYNIWRKRPRPSILETFESCAETRALYLQIFIWHETFKPEFNVVVKAVNKTK